MPLGLKAAKAGNPRHCCIKKDHLEFNGRRISQFKNIKNSEMLFI